MGAKPVWVRAEPVDRVPPPGFTTADIDRDGDGEAGAVGWWPGVLLDWTRQAADGTWIGVVRYSRHGLAYEHALPATRLRPRDGDEPPTE